MPRNSWPRFRKAARSGEGHALASKGWPGSGSGIVAQFSICVNIDVYMYMYRD